MQYNCDMKTNSSLRRNHRDYTPRLTALSLLAMLLALALAGCRSETAPSSAAINPDGVYALVSVDGQAVPCRLKHQGGDMLINSGAFTIRADGTCDSLMKFSVAGQNEVTREVTATYTQSGAELMMNWKGAGQTKGQVQGNEFTMNNEGMVLVYRK
jgi:hypothetical protein